MLLQCAEEMGCESPQYFNLCVPLRTATDETVDRWLDLNLTLESLGLDDGDSVHFKIKYFKVPSYKLDVVSLQLFFIQAKDSIFSGKYHVPERLAILLAAFQLQIFYGSYDPEASWLGGLAQNLGEFLPHEHATTGDLGQWSRRIIHYYQYLFDLTASEATYGYLAVARRVPACGAYLFPVMQGKLHVTIGIVEDGVIFLKDGDKKSNFEFFGFDDLLAWANTDTGVALRLQKRTVIQSLPTIPPTSPSPGPQPIGGPILPGSNSPATIGSPSPVPGESKRNSLQGGIHTHPQGGTSTPTGTASHRSSVSYSSASAPPHSATPPFASETSSQPQEAEYFQMRVNYDCAPEQSLTIIDLLEGYNWLLSRKSQERTRMLISEGLSPVASPSAYMTPSRRVQDELFGSKMDLFLHSYNRACTIDRIRQSSALLHRVDELDFPGRLQELELASTNLDMAGSVALLNAIEACQKYKSFVGDRTVTHNFELAKINVERNKVSPSFLSVASICPSLTSLNLCGNNFTREDGNTLINALKTPPYYLRELDLSDNDLGDKCILSLALVLAKCPHLRELNLGATGIKTAATLTELGRLIGQLTHFEKITLQRNKLSDSAIDSFVTALEQTLYPASSPAATGSASDKSSSSPNLGAPSPVISPASNPLFNSGGSNKSARSSTGLPSGQVLEPGTLSAVSSPTTGGGVISPDHSTSFPSLLPSGYHIDLRSCGLTSKGLVQLCAFIKRHKNVRTLRVAGNSLSSASSLVDALKEDVKMMILDVGDAAFGKRGWLELFVAMARQADSCRFDATGGLDKYGWAGLRMYLRDVLTRVSHLEFKNCVFSSSSQVITSLSDILGHPQCFVTTLVLKGASFGKKEFVPFAEVLASSAPSLMRLDLSCCKLDNVAAAYIGRALKSNYSLMELNLDANSFNNFAAKEFADALAGNHTLEILSLKRNALSSDCLPLWLHTFTVNSSLQMLDLRQNAISLDMPSRALLRSVPCTTQILI